MVIMVFPASNNYVHPVDPNKHNQPGDRHIPLREETITSIASYKLMHPGESPYAEESVAWESEPSAVKRAIYKNQLCEVIHEVPLNVIQNSSILKYKVKKGTILADAPKVSRRAQYNFPRKPQRTLDVPKVTCNVCYNVVSWSKSNILGVGLAEKLYTYNVDRCEIGEIFDTEDTHKICSVDWFDEQRLVCGDSSSQVTIIDVEKKEKDCFSFSDHHFDIYSLTHLTDSLTYFFGVQNARLYRVDFRGIEGSRSANIGVSDVPRNIVFSLKLSPSEKYLAAGCGDGNVVIYDLRQSSKSLSVLKSHEDAVLGLAWASDNILVTGGGGREKGYINVWNVAQSKRTYIGKTESLVTSLQLTKDGDVITTHGTLGNDIKVWNSYSNNKLLSQVASIQKHSDVILSSAINSEGSSLATISFDERLCLWDGFERIKSESVQLPGILSLAHSNNGIR